MSAASKRNNDHRAEPTVLLLIERRGSALRRVLTEAGYRVLESFTTDHAVAICVNNTIDAVILDQDCFVETDGWSVAQSIKAAKPNLCVLLVSRAKRLSKRMPRGVDAITPAENPQTLLAVLARLLPKTTFDRIRKIIHTKHSLSVVK